MTIVSVIVPNYNHARYLKQRIESILNQTFQDFELILLDDASTDESVEVLSGYKSNPKVSHFVVNETNSGSPFYQWKKGIELARGDYIWIAESDDFAHETFLMKSLNAINSNDKIKFSFSQSYVVDENSEIVGANYNWTDDINKERWKRDYTTDGRDEAIHFLTLKNTIPNASAVLFSRDLIHSVSYWPNDMEMTGDWVFWVQLISGCKITYLSQCLNYFRQLPTSTRVHDTFEKKMKRIKEELTVQCINDRYNDIPILRYKLIYKRLIGKLIKYHIANKKIITMVKFLCTSAHKSIFMRLLTKHF